jgi:tetratricopeptide (TPR) repeat protein
VSDTLSSDWTQLLRSALIHHQADRLAEAETLYRQVLKEQPRQQDALRLLGVLLRQRGKLQAARDLLVEALAIQPASAEAHHDLGLVQFDLKKYDDAIVSFRRAIELNPKFPEALHNLGNAYLAQWHFDDATQCYERALAQNPGLPESRRSLEWIRSNDLKLDAIAEYHRQSLHGRPPPASEASTSTGDGCELISRELLPHLLNKLGLTGIGVEVGVQEGNFSEHILQRWKGQLLYSIDPWRELPKSKYADVANVSQAKQDELYRSTIRRLMPFGGRSVIWRLTSGEGAELIPDQTLDFCYLDADHSYEAVTEDIRFWYGKMKRGGILAGHDYIPDGEYPFGVFGVIRAVNDFVRDSHLRLFVSSEPKFPSWFIIKR